MRAERPALSSPIHPHAPTAEPLPSQASPWRHTFDPPAAFVAPFRPSRPKASTLFASSTRNFALASEKVVRGAASNALAASPRSSHLNTPQSAGQAASRRPQSTSSFLRSAAGRGAAGDSQMRWRFRDFPAPLVSLLEGDCDFGVVAREDAAETAAGKRSRRREAPVLVEVELLPAARSRRFTGGRKRGPLQLPEDAETRGASRATPRGIGMLEMKVRKGKEIRELSTPEIEREILWTRQEIARLELLKRAYSTEYKPHLLKEARHLLAQLLTIRYERHLGLRKDIDPWQQGPLVASGGSCASTATGTGAEVEQKPTPPADARSAPSPAAAASNENAEKTPKAQNSSPPASPSPRAAASGAPSSSSKEGGAAPAQTRREQQSEPRKAPAHERPAEKAAEPRRTETVSSDKAPGTKAVQGASLSKLTTRETRETDKEETSKETTRGRPKGRKTLADGDPRPDTKREVAASSQSPRALVSSESPGELHGRQGAEAHGTPRRAKEEKTKCTEKTASVAVEAEKSAAKGTQTRRVKLSEGATAKTVKTSKADEAAKEEKKATPQAGGRGRKHTQSATAEPETLEASSHRAPKGSSSALKSRGGGAEATAHSSKLSVPPVAPPGPLLASYSAPASFFSLQPVSAARPHSSSSLSLAPSLPTPSSFKEFVASEFARAEQNPVSSVSSSRLASDRRGGVGARPAGEDGGRVSLMKDDQTPHASASASMSSLSSKGTSQRRSPHVSGEAAARNARPASALTLSLFPRGGGPAAIDLRRDAAAQKPASLQGIERL
ncbi:ribosomal protein RPL29 [Besnoitia besnoiti]|uniref:Ribosomal protein RPL29 n=1 Tax=Besnoitia besnoiti TaxID=94643 RepID=A0A2A9MG68_BESBE|nr:ribosomal protein RPL29 [Besnoitia besnoiti]PFH36909.1 ribosomal protein RPL29 [Besnoitia besnoiti]